MNNSVSLADESIDLIYLDPPFNSKSTYNLPFKGHYKRDLKPVSAFEDTWSWGENEADAFEKLKKGDSRDNTLANIIKLARSVLNEKPNDKISTSAYLVNMTVRLQAMKRVLKPTGAIYLHCDPTASHYLKMIMDAIYGSRNFRNEIVWSYRTGGVSKKWWSRKHDVIFFYVKSGKYKHNPLQERIYYEKPFFNDNVDEEGRYFADVYIRDVWEDIKPLINVSRERLGYPTQKPIALLDRIIKASSNEGDWILDPFCGCGTTMHAAEELDRNWIGIDISQFSTGLVRNRLYSNYKHKFRLKDIEVIGCPLNLRDAMQLAKRNKFEFEKWVCGEVGATGMFHEPGARGADGGVDGVIPFYYSDNFTTKKAEKTFAVVQVKGGKVSPDSVKALSTTVRNTGAKCGVFVCFDQYMQTVKNNREKRRIKSWGGDFDFIQGLSIESIINGERPKIPGQEPVIF